MAAIQRGEFDANPRLALNQSRRFRRWFERNNPNEEVREAELRDAAAEAHSVTLDAGEYNVVVISLFDCGESETDERFNGATTQTEWLARMYSILDETKAEIEEYVALAVQKCEDAPTVDKQPASSNIHVTSNQENKIAVRKEKPRRSLCTLQWLSLRQNRVGQISHLRPLQSILQPRQTMWYTSSATVMERLKC